MVKDWMLSPKIRNKTKISAFTASIQHCIGRSSQCTEIRNDKERKDIHIRKEVKLYLQMT